MSIEREIEQQLDLFEGLETSTEFVSRHSFTSKGEREMTLACFRHNFYSLTTTKCTFCASEKRSQSYRRTGL